MKTIENKIELELINELNEEVFNFHSKFTEVDEVLRQCKEEGKSCSYGICSECPKCLENGGN